MLTTLFLCWISSTIFSLVAVGIMNWFGLLDEHTHSTYVTVSYIPIINLFFGAITALRIARLFAKGELRKPANSNPPHDPHDSQFDPNEGTCPTNPPFPGWEDYAEYEDQLDTEGYPEYYDYEGEI